jgi:PAS domain S-box-containing protein
MPGKKILIVEDEAVTALDLKKSLISLGFDVISVEDRGIDAIRKIEKFKPDLILMDIVLKGEMDGIEAAEKINKLFDITIVYLTAYSSDKTFERAKLTGPYGFIVKPVDFYELKCTIETSFYRYDLEKELKEIQENLEFKVQKRTKELENLVDELTLKNFLLDSANDSIFLHDLQGNIIYVNEAGYKSRGYTKDELFGMNIWDLSPPEHNEQINTIIEEIKEKGEFIFESRDLCKDGSIMLLEIHSRFINLDGKNFILSVVRDISKRKENENKLRFQADILKNVRDCVIVYDLQGKIIYWNKGAESVYGYAGEEILGENIAKLYLKNDDNQLMHDLKEIRESGEYTGEWEGKRKDGSKVIVDIMETVMLDVNGEITGIIGISRDITERKQMEKERETLLEELKRSNEELRQFAYITSHDMQEPLRTIASFTQLLERRYKNRLDDDADEFMDYIVEASIRMKQMILDLLEYSKIGRNEKEFHAVDMEEVLNDIIINLHDLIERTDAEITHDPLPIVIGERDNLFRVLQNLIGNAIKFRKPDEPSKVYISAKYKKDKYIFSVKDNGIGIEKQYMERIFTIFQRLHTKDKYEGTGIGLSIVKRIIERHGGRIWVESEPGVGSTFYFTLKNEGEIED